MSLPFCLNTWWYPQKRSVHFFFICLYIFFIIFSEHSLYWWWWYIYCFPEGLGEGCLSDLVGRDGWSVQNLSCWIVSWWLRGYHPHCRSRDPTDPFFPGILLPVVHCSTRARIPSELPQAELASVEISANSSRDLSFVSFCLWGTNY